jgi:hypothetical protein
MEAIAVVVSRLRKVGSKVVHCEHGDGEVCVAKLLLGMPRHVVFSHGRSLLRGLRSFEW